MGRLTRPGLRLLAGAAVLVVLVRQVGTGPFLAGLRGISPTTVAAAVAVGAVVTGCSAWRWRVVAEALGVGLPLPAAAAAYYRSQFLNSTLPGGVLGDVARGLRHGADAGNRGAALRAVVWERLAGQVVSVAVALGALLVLPSPLPALRPWVAALAATAVGAAALLLLRRRRLPGHGPHRVLLRPATACPVVLASVLVVGGHAALFLLACAAAGLDRPPQEVLPLALAVLLAAAIPLNVGGWGPREGAAAGIFALAGWGAGTGAAAATAFGALTLAAVLPGAAVLLVDGLRRREAATHG